MENNKPWSSSEFLLPTQEFSPLNTKSLRRLKLDIREIGDDTLSIFLWNPDYFNESNTAESNTSERSVNSKYLYQVFAPEMFVEIKRKIDNKTLLSSARGPLIASDNYFEWSIHLYTETLMGFDELHLKEGQRILINNEHVSVIPYVIAYGR